MEYDEWLASVKEELVRKTGRHDIEVTGGPYRSYDVEVSSSDEDGHPIVDFYSAMRYDFRRVGPAMQYAIQMLSNWEANKVIHDKAKRDSEGIFKQLQARFPDMELQYTVIDSDQHYLRVSAMRDRPGGKLVASFDLWPNMTDKDIERLANYISEHRKQVEGGCSMSGTDYW